MGRRSDLDIDTVRNMKEVVMKEPEISEEISQKGMMRTNTKKNEENIMREGSRLHAGKKDTGRPIRRSPAAGENLFNWPWEK